MPGVLPFLAEGGVRPAQALSHGQDASIMAHEALSAHTWGAGSPGFLILRQAGLNKVVRHAQDNCWARQKRGLQARMRCHRSCRHRRRRG